MATLLQQAIDLATSGNRSEAETILQQVLADQPDNEAAWMWLSGVTRDKSVKQDALQKALSLNPNNALAQKGLTRFGGVSSAPVPAPPPVVEDVPPPPVDATSPPLAEQSQPDLSFLDDPDPLSSATSLGFEQDAPVPETPAESAVDFSFLDDTDDGTSPDLGAVNLTAEPDQEPALDLSFLSDTEDPPSLTPSAATESPEPDLSFLTDDTTDDNAFNFDFGDEALDTTITQDSGATKTDDSLEWGDFNFEEDTPFNFDLDSGTQEPVAEAGDQLSTTDDTDDTFNFDFFETGDTDAGVALPADDAPDEPSMSNLLTADPPPTTSEDADSDFNFDWDNATDFDLDTSAEAAPVDDGDFDADAFDLLNRLGDGDDDTSDEVEINFDDITDEPEVDENDPAAVARATAQSRQQQQKQQGLLILSVMGIVFVILLAAALWILDTDLGRYRILPPPDDLTRQAPSPDGAGTATMNFNGYPANRAAVRWTLDNEAATCQNPGVGLVVNFGDGKDPLPLSNQLCSGGQCLYEKPDLTGANLTQVAVGYQCGRDAEVTLFTNVP
ncbi:MAG: hypothetical protein AAF629_06815 [Chloroflexota bacterium]